MHLRRAFIPAALQLCSGFGPRSAKLLHRAALVRGGRSSTRPLTTTMSATLEAVEAAAPVEKFRKDYTPTAYSIDYVKLDFDIRDERTLVTSTLAVGPRAGTAAGAALVLDGEDLDLLSIEINGQPVPGDGYTYAGDVLTVASPPPGRFELTTKVGIKPKENTQLSGLYASSGNYCTQCEAEGFRRITFFYDRPDVMARYSVRVEAPKAAFPVLLSNGNEVGRGDLQGGDRHWASFEDPFPKPSYLFALVAGNLGGIEGTFRTMSGRDVRLAVWSEHENCDQLDWSLESLRRSMRWDEERYGREYDLDVYHIVAVNDFNMGAMENKGLNVFNTACVLAKPSTATDGDYERVLGVVAHEYFHNWSGNRVTCRDWFQLTLKEGLTVFRDQHFTEEQTSEAVKRIDDVRVMRSAQFTQDAGPMAHPIRPESYIAMDNFYTVTVYNKGAEVIRMYRTLLGPEGFRKGMDLYFDRHDGSAVTCDDFREAMSDANTYDLTAFERWYTQAGTPRVTITDRGLFQGDSYTFRATQATAGTPGQPAEAKQPFVIPIQAALLDAATGEKVAEELFVLFDVEATFTFAAKDLAPSKKEYVVSLLRGFSAPCKLDYEPALSLEELQFLARADDDPVNRWDAAQQLAARLVLDRYAGEETNATAVALLDAFKTTLEADDLDASLRAVALVFPDLATLLLQLPGDVDPTRLSEALDATKLDVATATKAELAKLYDALAPTSTEFSVDAATVGNRRLRNTCLAYLAKLDGDEHLQRCRKHFDEATCMTDSLAAASCLAPKVGTAERAAVLEAFYARAKKNNEQLVLNKWFALQASAKSEDALALVKELTKHPDFDTNPNRFRSVISTFAAANPTFHAADGSGYDFIADEVVAIDKINPQLAARLCGVFGSWRRFDAGRRKQMQAALAKIKDAPKLSKDTFEIATRSLA